MIDFFADLYPGELIYSGMARYKYYIGKNIQEVIEDLVGQERIAIGLESYAGISKLANKLGGSYTVSYLVNNHTNLKAYIYFAKDDIKKKILNEIEEGKYSPVKWKLALKDEFFRHKDGIFYCEECAKEDVAKFGETYIHRNHQLPGVLACPKHKSLLKKYKQYTREDCSRDLIKIDYIQIDGETKNDKYIEYVEKLCQYAVYAEKILNMKVDYRTRQENLAKYKQMLRARGFLKFNGDIRQQELHEAFTKFWSKAILQDLNCMFPEGINVRNSWLGKMVRGKENTVNIINNILYIVFLGGNIDNTIDVGKKVYFEDSLEICRNKFCEKYKHEFNGSRQIIEKYNRRYNNKKPIMLCECTQCGYAYYYNYGGSFEDKKIRVSHYGLVWEKELIRYLGEDSYTLENLAGIMECDIDIIKRYIQVLNSKGGIPTSMVTSKIPLDKFLLYKHQIEEATRDNKGLNRNDIQKLVGTGYRVIWAFDREWMEQVLPQKEKFIKSRGIDWDEEDKKYENVVKQVYINILKEKPLKRVTLKKIASDMTINRGNLNEKLKYMPRTKKLIKSIIETNQQYKLRKCKKVIEELLNENKVILLNQVLQKAKIRKDRSQDIKDELEEYIKTIKQYTQYVKMNDI